MAHIIEFSVSGLAGRKDTYHNTLYRDVNIFYGLNGSGKTSLLKILNSAMDFDSRSLINVPFKNAEVKIYSITFDAIFTHTIEKKFIKKSKAKASTKKRDIVLYTAENLDFAHPSKKPTDELTQLPNWNMVPKPRHKTDGWAHIYLPTSRLYTGRSGYFPQSDIDIYEEDELDKLFELFLQSLWDNYNGDIVRSINKAQQDGLANILKALLSGKRLSKRVGSQINISKAYERMSNFLKRQGSPDIIGSFNSFESNYRRNSQLQSVVHDIDRTEESITKIMAPRNQLESLIQIMFSGNKRLQFTDKSIDVLTKEKDDIGVRNLSSGEKHALLLFIQSLRSEDNTMLIDEPEISMHIDWQRGLVNTMHQLNPSAQLILATHSPDIMSEVDDERIFHL